MLMVLKKPEHNSGWKCLPYKKWKGMARINTSHDLDEGRTPMIDPVGPRPYANYLQEPSAGIEILHLAAVRTAIFVTKDHLLLAPCPVRLDDSEMISCSSRPTGARHGDVRAD